MTMKTAAWIAGAALLVTACGQKNESATETAPDNGAMAGSQVDNVLNMAEPAGPNQSFLNTAAASDAFEIASSQLAATSASSSAVKSFAAKMVAAHQESTAKLKTAASSATPALTPDPALPPDLQQKLDALKAKTGGDFDRAYMAEQVAAHQGTLDALNAYAAGGDQPSLKQFATSMIPIVTAHLNMAKGIKP